MDKKSVSLLEDIRNEAIDNKVDIATILRKCQILASKLGNVSFKNWVSCELNGYFDGKEVPKYRIKIVDSYGTLVGSFGRQMSNVVLPLHNLPPKIAEALSIARFEQGVDSLQALLEGSKNNKGVFASWPPEIIARYQGKFYVEMNLISAYKAIPKATIRGVLSAIRNRVLEFVLKISEDLGDELGAIPKSREANAKVENIFNTHIYGDGNRIATNCESVDQSVFVQLCKGNWDILSASLTALNVSAEDQALLKKALREEPPTGPTSFGSKVSSWLGKVVTNISTATAAQIIVKAISNYCGF